MVSVPMIALRYRRIAEDGSTSEDTQHFYNAAEALRTICTWNRGRWQYVPLEATTVAKLPEGTKR